MEISVYIDLLFIWYLIVFIQPGYGYLLTALDEQDCCLVSLKISTYMYMHLCDLVYVFMLRNKQFYTCQMPMTCNFVNRLFLCIFCS